jgi:hypothetical protein
MTALTSLLARVTGMEFKSGDFNNEKNYRSAPGPIVFGRKRDCTNH